MFCKWCGSNIEAGSHKCARCGREQPAMSDCGGFFDLVPKAKEDFVLRQPSDSANKAVDCSDANASKKAARCNNGKIIYFALGLCVIAIVMMLIHIIRADDSNVTELDDKTVKVHATFEEDGDDISVKTSAECDDKPLPVVHKASFNKEKHTIVGINYDFDNDAECIDISVSVDQERKADGSRSVLTQIDVATSVFSNIEGEETFEWSYRVGRDSEWIDVDDGVFVLSENGKVVSYNSSALKKLLKSNENSEIHENIELRLKYFRKSEEGGSLEIIVDGIVIVD